MRSNTAAQISTIAAKPILKWAGGKTQMLGELLPKVPSSYGRYIEPFFGGGALFFALQPENAVIADSNPELINMYRQVADHVDGVISYLEKYQNTSEMFYSVRSLDWETLPKAEAAARTIYLNRTCYNGLYRVNKKGQFNVPYGKYKNPKICDTEALHAASQALRKADIVCGDYRIIGFCYSGIGKKLDEAESYNLDLDLTEYIEKIKAGTNILSKLHRDKLYAMNSDGTPFVICSIYAALVFQIKYDEKNYILCSGTWYYVESSFFNQVNSFINAKIPLSNVNLPDCPSDKDEGAYNEMVAESNPDFCLMDRKLIAVENGPKKIEACDIFTRDKKLIHVKNKGQSAQLSHLFSQGKVAAECFVSDLNFRKQVSDIAVQKFGSEVFDYNQKPQSSEFEIVYAIIDTKSSSLEAKLPFFSKVNLMITAQELDRMHFKFSVCCVQKV